MVDDEFDDIFKIMDRIFGESPIGSHYRSPINDNKYERLMDGDNIYYTFELRELSKDDIDIKPYTREIIVTFNKGINENRHVISLPYPIKPKDTEVSFINGILDIIVKIDKDKEERIEIKEGT